MDPGLPYVMMVSLDYTHIISLIIILCLLLCSAMISGSEVALFSLKATDFPKESEDYTKNHQILIHLLDRPQRLLATILIANMFINIAVVLLFDDLGDKLFGDIEVIFYGINLQFVLKVFVATFFILLFGEILPKIYASRKTVVFAHFIAVPLNVLDRILGVFSVPMRTITQMIYRNLGDKRNQGLSVDQLSKALDLTDKKETTEEEQEILQSIVSFGNTDTKQVMQPRTDIFALSIDQRFRDIIPLIIEHGYSRIPVYEESLDQIKGILYIKDLLPYIDEEDFKWQNLLREGYFVPGNKKIDDLLNEFKDKKIHLAIVVDEYGGTNGLISMEDIMEEIVGEISDEFDEDDLIFSKLDESTFVFDGKTALMDFYRITQIENPNVFEEQKGDAETLAGFLLEISGGFPKTGEKIQFEQYAFTVEAIDQKRIKQIKFSER